MPRRIDTRERILDAAERRLRSGGYNGFSFRDLAGDVDVRSASVHHHFPTKEDLVARLTARYAERFLAEVADAPTGRARIAAYRDAFRRSLESACSMCLCGLLGAESAGLPRAVSEEARRFFETARAQLAAGLEGETDTPQRLATAVLAQLEGATLLARVFGDPRTFDEATDGLERLATRADPGARRLPRATPSVTTNPDR